MARLRHILAGCVLTLASLGSAAQTTAAAAADSVDRAVAVFIASNIKLAITNALQGITDTGLAVDTAAVRAMLPALLAEPYNTQEHDAAVTAIDKAINSLTAKESAELLAKAAAAPGAVTLPSGVVVETILDGKGDTLTPDATVHLRYTGRLPDGTVFDSIGLDQEPMTTVVSDLVAGMTEGLTHMRRGGEYRLTVPADQAYGAAGVPGVIPPGSALQFDISVLEQ